MKKHPQWIVAALLSFTLAACATPSDFSAQPEPKPANIAWATKGDFCEPETVLPLPDETLLISNVCNFQSSGDGYLSLLNPNGTVIDWRIVDDLDSPLGMALHDDKIYVVDNNRVKSFSWPTFERISEIQLKTEVANDIAVSADGTIYVSDTSSGAVFTLTGDGLSQKIQSTIEFSGANGLAFSQDGALYVGGAQLWRINPRNGDAKIAGPRWLKDIDGIEFEQDGPFR